MAPRPIGAALTQPWRTPTRELLEKDVENPSKDWARRRGWWVKKFKSPGNRSVPDDLFAKAGRKLAVEFKRPGKKPTEKQLKEQAAMIAAGWEVYNIDNYEDFVALFTRIESELFLGG